MLAGGGASDPALGNRCAVIGMVGARRRPIASATPVPATLEARLATAGGNLFIPTRPAPEIDTLPERSGSALNPTYFTLTPASFNDFEWLVFLDSTDYPRGARPLSDWSG